MAAERVVGVTAGRTSLAPRPSHGPVRDRAREFRRARRHTIFVKVFRVILPLTALGVWSLYVLPHVLPQGLGLGLGLGPVQLPFDNAQVSIQDVDLSPEELTMVNPRLEGSTDGGGRYLVEADQAIQALKKTDEVRLKVIRASVDDPKSGKATIQANQGELKLKQERLYLYGDILVRNEKGMTAKLELAYIDFKSQFLHSNRPVEMDLLGGTVRGRTLALYMKEKRAVFEKGVRVRIYQKSKAASVDKGQSGRTEDHQGSGQTAAQSPAVQ